MTGVLKKTAEALRAVDTGKKLAVGVSGGRDSVCLLHAVLSCGAVKKENVLAVHVDHGLRDTAARDERFVRELCASLGTELVVFKVDVRGYAASNGLSVETAARELRYNAFASLLGDGRADFILTAHHALDNAESVLMHLFRGCGLDGLRGMAGASDFGGRKGVLLRPFLGVYPDELEAYRAENGLEFVTDETNFSPDADRNFIRLKVVPLIEERYKGVVRAVNALSRECAGACELLDGELDMTLISRDRGAVTVECEALRSPLASRYVRYALKNFSLVDVTREQVERTVALCAMRSGATVKLPHGLCAVREYDRVAFFEPKPLCREQAPLSVGTAWLGGVKVTVREGDFDPRSVAGGAADLDALEGAVLRFRRDGDVFTPFGGGSKKLKQYLIDRKIPRRLRDTLPLVCRGNEALVICGVQVSEKVKVTDKTVRVAALEADYE